MHTKTIAANKAKGNKWTATPRGSHKKSASITLINVIKDLGYADKTAEAKKIIHTSLVLVDGKICKKPAHGIGFMDVISHPKIKKNYLATAVKAGLKLKETTNSKTKLCRVIGKKTIGKEKNQLNLHDGSNIICDKTVSVNDTVVLELPQRKIKEILPYAVKSQAIIISGRHRGQVGEISEILPGTAARKSLTTVAGIQTLTAYVFIIGKDKPVIDV